MAERAAGSEFRVIAIRDAGEPDLRMWTKNAGAFKPPARRSARRKGQHGRNGYCLTRIAESEAKVWVVTVEVPLLAHSAMTI